ncbi:hypothetical protein [Haloarcula limicola]|uniref:hypothetical protein n=1 Tax=Haloarcula limicola TaxID=1429915 RepID=UPI001391FA40|nr:hypothetical protein [Halomicroarcula limicola]
MSQHTVIVTDHDFEDLSIECEGLADVADVVELIGDVGEDAADALGADVVASDPFLSAEDVADDLPPRRSFQHPPIIRTHTGDSNHEILGIVCEILNELDDSAQIDCF